MRLGTGTTARETAGGKLAFGDKDAQYLEEKSREAVEEINNVPILYFGLDWERSKRNFYGELTTKRFKNPQGTQVRGKYKLTQGDMTVQNGVPYKIMNLVVSIYTEQLKELGIDPLLGEYFYMGSRYYLIWDKTINDAGPGHVNVTGKRMRCDYSAYEVDDETIQKATDDGNPGPDFNINHDFAGDTFDS